jgi:hypothetical protein
MTWAKAGKTAKMSGTTKEKYDEYRDDDFCPECGQELNISLSPLGIHCRNTKCPLSPLYVQSK